MQLLCKSSEEFGYTKGIGLIDTDIISWKKSKDKFYDIHIGFNSVIFNKNMKLLKELKIVQIFILYIHFMQSL